MRKLMIGILVSMLFVIGGCSNKTSSSYNRDTSAGSIGSIDKEGWEKKIKNKESFILLFSQPTCAGCIELKGILDTYLKTHNLNVFDYSINTENMDRTAIDSLLNDIKKTFPKLSVTPDLYYIYNGKVEARYEQEGDITADLLDAWVKENKMDEKK